VQPVAQEQPHQSLEHLITMLVGAGAEETTEMALVWMVEEREDLLVHPTRVVGVVKAPKVDPELLLFVILPLRLLLKENTEMPEVLMEQPII
jgi:hypothetical protein